MSLGTWDYVWFPWTVTKWLWEKVSPKRNPQEPGRPPQVSAHGGAVPIAFGKTRLTANLVYFSSEIVQVTPVFRGRSTKVMAALCEGPIAGVARCWMDKDVKATPGERGWTVFTGTRPTQSVWTDLPAAKQLGYPGLAYLAQNHVSALEQWPGIGQQSFEVQGLLHATGDAVKGDADPSQIVDVLLRDRVGAGSTYGVGLGVPFDVRVSTGRDGNAASSYARYVSQEGLWLSPALTERRPTAEHLKDILEASNATCLWAGGGAVLEIVPLGDTAVGTYTPYVTPQYALTPSHFIDGRIELELGAEADVYNVCPVEFLDREPPAAATDTGHAYNVAIEADPEPLDSSTKKERRADAVAMHSICQRSVALKVSRIRAQQMVHVRNRYRFKLSAFTFGRLEPLDFVTLEDDRLGLVAEPVRIEKISRSADHVLTVAAIQWPYGVGGAVPHTTAGSDGPLGDLQGMTIAEATHILAARNWTLRGSVTWANKSTTAVIWTGEQFVALVVGVGGTEVVTSYDGIAWAVVATLAGSHYGLAFDGTTYVVVGAGDRCSTSTNLTAWTPRTMPTTGLDYGSVAHNGSQWVATHTNGFAYSADAATWSAGSITGGSISPTSVTWSSTLGRWAAVGGGGVTAYSSNGVNWTRVAGPVAMMGVGNSSAASVAWNGKLFTAVGWIDGGASYTPVILTSTDGISWTLRYPSMIGTSEFLKSVVWTGAVWVALGSSLSAATVRGVTWTSVDGDTWAGVGDNGLAPNPANGWQTIAWTGHSACAGGSGGASGTTAFATTIVV